MPFLGTTGGGSVKQYGGLANLGYFIKNSLRTRASASGYLNKTLTTPTNNLKWTWSAWIKRGTLSVANVPFGAGDGTSDNFGSLQFTTSDTLQFAQISGGTYNVQMITSAVFRDPAAWYHIVIIYDSANATSTDRVQIYVNSVRQSVTYSTGPFAQNTASKINSAIAHYISKLDYTTVYFDGYQAEVNFVDGQALTPSSFGKTDAATNQWIPKKFAGTYGTNGFYLKFSDTSAATAAAIGKDSSGNGNNWTPNNISVTAGATYDAMIDSPTLSAVASNYCVINPLDFTGTKPTVTNGNLQYANATDSLARGTLGILNEKVYWEFTQVSTVDGSNPMAYGAFGLIGKLAHNSSAQSVYAYTDNGVAKVFERTTAAGVAVSVTPSSFTVSVSDIIQIAYDGTTGKIWIGKNNNWYDSSGGQTGNPSTGANALFTLPDLTNPMVPGFEHAGAPYTVALNCGQRPFAYTPPTGFKSLNTYNLP